MTLSREPMGLAQKLRYGSTCLIEIYQFNLKLFFSKAPPTQGGVELETIEVGVSREFVGGCPRF
jgi:hypothetical protein